MRNLSKALDIWTTTVRVAPNLLKAQAILSDITVWRSVPLIGNQNKGRISWGDQQAYYLQVFPRLCWTPLTSSRRLLPNLKTSGKQDSFRHVLKSSASIHESLDSQFYRTTNGIHSWSESFDESGLVMTFLTILGITWLLCSVSLVLEKIQVMRWLSHQD